ncbi:tyrosine-type recombinase/integrase [Bradyrhizobium sp. USDA 329]|uniref:tyrosine-type recombinase/integrase n=1 Tax=unclassified Bradyrhizobium TaxID=2631580 RepID=UPI003511EF4C
MNFFYKKLSEAALERAAVLPSLIEGEREPKWSIRMRPSGYYALCKDGEFFESTGLDTEPAALEFLDTWKLQCEALRDGTVDVRRSSATAIIEHRIKIVHKKKLRGASVIESTLNALKPFVEGRQLRHLNDEWLDEVEEGMCENHSRTYYTNAIYFYRTAIRGWCRACSSAPILPFEAPPREAGRKIVLHKAQRDRVVRWAGGTEDFNPKTGRWTPREGGLSANEANCRQVTYRKMHLGLTFGSRPGVYECLGWEPNEEGGHLDLDEGIFHRVPLGASTAANKLSPSVPIPPEALAEYARWRETDGDSPWVFRNLDGSPSSLRRQQDIFSEAMAALGIENMTGHILRHTAITMMIEMGETAAAISAVCGISIAVLHRVYDHSDNRAVQKLALGSMDRMMR